MKPYITRHDQGRNDMKAQANATGRYAALWERAAKAYNRTAEASEKVAEAFDYAADVCENE